jgi:hypothetical protein
MKMLLLRSRKTEAYTYAMEESKYAPISRTKITRVP